MYLKFVNELGEVIRYNETKKHPIIRMVLGFKSSENRKYKIIVNKITIDITRDIELLHQIYVTDFGKKSFNFQSVFTNANFYAAIPQQKNGSLLILFGNLYLNIQTQQFYNVPIINSNVLLQNATPAETPYYYRTEKYPK